MSDFDILIDDGGLAAQLGRNLRPAIEAGAQGIAAEIQNVLAPYPPAPPRRAGRPYYVRGKGMFTATGVQISQSEMLNRRWSIRPVPLGARLQNTASYASYVHGVKDQMRLHGQRGWVREDRAVEQVERSGEMQRVMEIAIAAALEVEP